MPHSQDRPAASRPLTFAGCAGHLHGSPADLAVLVCPPWGYEDLLARETSRLLAERIAASGALCLRFDYPGTGNSAGEASAIVSPEAWHGAVDAGLDLLRGQGARRLVVVGWGLGAVPACSAAKAHADIAGLALIAPVTHGADYVRMLCEWDEALGAELGYFAPDVDIDGVTNAGFAMSSVFVQSLASIDLAAGEAPNVGRILLAGPVGDGVAAWLAQGGAAVETMSCVPFRGRLPSENIGADGQLVTDVAAWVAGYEPRPAEPRTNASLPVSLAGEGWTETSLRFGAGSMLAGVYCAPQGAHQGVAALIVNAGEEPHSGWGRSGTELARHLAASGFASLRYDASGTGDSPAAGAVPCGWLDFNAALECLAARGWSRIVLIGRGKAADLCLNASGQDERIVAIGVGDPRLPLPVATGQDEGVSDVAMAASVQHDGKPLRPAALMRLLRQKINVVAALRAVVARRMAPGHEAPTEDAVSPGAALDALHRRLAQLRDRAIPVSLVCAEGETAVDVFEAWFDKGRALARYPNTGVTVVPGADRHFTQCRARRTWYALMLELLRSAAYRQGAGGREPEKSSDVNRAA